MEKLAVRKAEKIDIDTIFELINGLAKYEKRPWDMTGTKEELSYWLFERKIATTLLVSIEGKTIGYAIYYPIFGSFSAKGKVHLEDISAEKVLANNSLQKSSSSFLMTATLVWNGAHSIGTNPPSNFMKKLAQSRNLEEFILNFQMIQ